MERTIDEQKVKEVLNRNWLISIDFWKRGKCRLRVLAFPGCQIVINQNDSLDDALKRLHELMRVWIRSYLAEGKEIPTPGDWEYDVAIGEDGPYKTGYAKRVWKNGRR